MAKKRYTNEETKNIEIVQQSQGQSVLYPDVIGQAARESYTDYSNARSHLISVTPGENIQDAIDTLITIGRGTVLLKNGTHKVNYNIDVPSSVILAGETRGASIVDFGGTSKSVRLLGSSAYSTGSVTVTNGATTVTGNFTSWSTNAAAGQYILIKGIWYPIALVGGDTTLYIGLPFAEDDVAGETYIIATIVNDTGINNLTITNSATTGILIQYANRITIDNINVTSSLIGITADDSSSLQVTNVNLIANNINLNVGNCHYIAWYSAGMIDSQAAQGMILSTVTNSQFSATFVMNSAGDGISIGDCSNLHFTGVVSVESTGQGVEMLNDNSNIVFTGCRFQDNSSEGVKLTATTDKIFFTNCSFAENGTYGLNIAAASCDNNNVTGNTFTSNGTANMNDAGTGTLIRGNIGVDDNTVNSLSANLASIFLGGGVDGDATISADTSLAADKYYDNLTIDSGFSLDANGYKIYVADTLTVNGTLHNNGEVGTAGTATPGSAGAGGGAGTIAGGVAGQAGGQGNIAGGSNGVNGTALNPSLGSNGVAGGKGGNGLGGAGGTAGTAGTATGETISTNYQPFVETLTAGVEVDGITLINVLGSTSAATLSASAGSGSGGGAAGDSTNNAGGSGGGSGGSGGALLVAAKTISVSASGVISSNGGNGGNGGSGGALDRGGGGGGGGGSGGVIVLIYSTLTNAGSLTASGGTKGTGGAGGGGAGLAGANGTDGLAGKIYKLKMLV